MIAERVAYCVARTPLKIKKQGRESETDRTDRQQETETDRQREREKQTDR